MFKNESGFTLIELVLVIVILGILAATAIPRFVDLSADAEKAALSGVVGAVSSAAAINYAAALAGNSSAVVYTSASTCNSITTDIMTGGLPGGYTTTTAAPVGTLTNGGMVTCAISITGSTTAAENASIIWTGT